MIMSHSVLKHFPIIFAVVIFGCTSPTVNKSIDKSPNLKKPVKETKEKASKVNKEAGNIEKQSKSIEKDVKGTEVQSEVEPELSSIFKSTDIIQEASSYIRINSDKLLKMQKQIDKRSSRIKELKEQLKKEKRKNDREVQHLWTWLQIGGMVLVGIGVGVGFLIKRVGFGIAVSSGGLAITLVSRFLQMYEWVLMLFTGIIIVVILSYVTYLLIIHRNTLWKELKGKRNKPSEEKIRRELEDK